MRCVSCCYQKHPIKKYETGQQLYFEDVRQSSTQGFCAAGLKDMKKSKSSSGSKEKRKRSAVEDKKKRLKPLPKAEEKDRRRENGDKHPRKSRWEACKSNMDESNKHQFSTSKTDDTSHPEPPQRIKDLLGDKKKIVEYLFVAISGTALQELIPDYLKNRSIEELKKMCYAEIKDMSEEIILGIASGKDPSPPDQTQSTSRKVDVKPAEEKKCKDEGDDNYALKLDSSLKMPSPDVSESCSGDVLELCASSTEINSLTDNENEVPASVDQEATEDLHVADSEADLIELEMRARAIRSLLKAKNQLLSDSD